MLAWQPFLAEVEGAWAASLLVQLIVLLALLGGVAKCWSISRRPRTNTKCVMALQLMLIGWLIPLGYIGFSTLLGYPLPFDWLVSMVSFAVVLAAVVLAFLGLHEYSRGQGRYTQGKVQAICTVVFGGLVAVLPILAAVEARWNVFGTRSGPAGARVLVFEDLNFRFFTPGGRWVQVETNGFQRNAALALACRRPELHFIVLAEKAPSESFSVNDLAEMAQRNLSNAVAAASIVYRGPTRIERLEGLRLDSEVEQSGQRFYYQLRLFTSHGFAYQLIAWGRLRDEGTVAEEMNYLARQFELLGNPAL